MVRNLLSVVLKISHLLLLAKVVADNDDTFFVLFTFKIAQNHNWSMYQMEYSSTMINIWYKAKTKSKDWCRFVEHFSYLK